MKKAIIVGHTGQDGTYLHRLLGEKKYSVTGISSRSVLAESANVPSRIDITDSLRIAELIRVLQPDEIYYLAAVHQSSSDRPIGDGELFQRSFDINVKAYVNFLEAVRLHSPHTKVFYAASSHVFGSPEKMPQDESTPFNPDCVYGITKTAGIRISRFYRENHRLFASVGIFYNHESPLREPKYVSRKIVEAAVAIKRGKQNELVLGNIDSKIDWGYAPDYMKAVHGILQAGGPDDFVLSSGALHSIRDFVSGVFNYLGLDWEKYVKVNPALITKKQKQNLFGDNSKAGSKLGWRPGTDFNTLIRILTDEEMKKQ